MPIVTKKNASGFRNSTRAQESTSVPLLKIPKPVMFAMVLLKTICKRKFTFLLVCDAPIEKGKRFHCEECSDYDLCQTCAFKGMSNLKHTKTHKLRIMDNPNLVNYLCDGKTLILFLPD